ncbi:MAG TPA: class I SAM-dependent methyltransferase [Pseudomonadales bacterium]|nr:class I SAM-dependent methyltransferase [Pseudomonadales bacterium]
MGQTQALQDKRAQRAAALYNKLALTFYDFYVYRFAAPIAFRCPVENMSSLYQKYCSKQHLEIGVGTGHFLQQAHARDQLQTVTLLDLNPNCLQITAEKLKGLTVHCYEGNILHPFPLKNERFSSVGLNFVLHCVPGSFAEKGIIFKHLKPYLLPDAVVFGSTAIYESAKRNLVGPLVMNAYNALGIFNNKQDQKRELIECLSSEFKYVNIEQIGNILFFVASDQRIIQ